MVALALAAISATSRSPTSVPAGLAIDIDVAFDVSALLDAPTTVIAGGATGRGTPNSSLSNVAVGPVAVCDVEASAMRSPCRLVSWSVVVPELSRMAARSPSMPDTYRVHELPFATQDGLSESLS